MPETMRFPDHTGVPFQPEPPDVDGFAEPEPAMSFDFGNEAARVDTGWNGAARRTFGDATTAGLAAPLVAILGLKHRTEDYLFLSVVVRRDPAFDDRDRVVLVLHPTFAAGSAAKTGDERRIDVEPVSTGAGAGTAPPNESDPWGLTEDNVGFKTDRAARNVEYYRWDVAAAAWVSTPPPSGVRLRVRSWDGGTNNRNWSLEARLPTSRATGGADWVDMSDSIGFFLDVVRATSGTPAGLDFVTQFVWPTGSELDDNGGLLDLDQIPIDPALLGNVILGSTAPGPAVRGVDFDGGYGAVGARAPGSGSAPGSQIVPTANEFVARVRNDDATAAAANVTAEFRIANWGIGPGTFAKWNKLVPDSGHTNPSAPVTLPAASTGGGGAVVPSAAELTTRWTPPAGQYGVTLDLHQCTWVRLDSNQSVSFVRSGTVRNMNLVGLSDHEQDAEVSGVGYPEDQPGDLDFLLLTSQVAVSRRLDADPEEPEPEEPEPDEPDGPVISAEHRRAAAEVRATGRAQAPAAGRRTRDVRGPREDGARFEQVFITVVDGYRRTPRTLTIDGTRFPVYAYCDSFGHTGVHRSSSLDVLDLRLTGSTLSPLSTGVYRLPVPRDGTARLTTTLRTRRPTGKAPWWLRWLLRLLRRLLGPILRRLGLA